MIAGHTDADAGRWPNTFLVGGPRCGTTAMYEHLKSHPDIFMSRVKEPLFLSSDLTGLPGSAIASRDEYLALFQGANGRPRRGEASPFYLYSPRAAADIARYCRDPRIIVMLRNPADMMYSLYWAWAYSGFERARTFESALAAEQERARETPLPFGLLYRALSRFPDHLERMLTLFGAARVHVVIFDDLVRDTAGTYAGVCRFLGVRDDVRPDFGLGHRQRAASRRPLLASLSRAVTAPPQALRAFLGCSRLASFVRDSIRTWATVSPPQMRADTRERLIAECWPDVLRTGHLIGRDLQVWGRPRPDALDH